MKKFISYIFLGCIPAMLMGQFTPPTSNSAVMVNESTQLVNPTASELLDANPEFEQLIYDTAFVVDGWQIIVDTTPSINPNDYISETSKNITIQTPYYDISALQTGKVNMGEHLFEPSSYLKIPNSGILNGNVFSICFFTDFDFQTVRSSSVWRPFNVGAFAGVPGTSTHIYSEVGAFDGFRVSLGGASNINNFTLSNIRPFATNKWNAVSIIVYSNNKAPKLFINGNEITNSSGNTISGWLSDVDDFYLNASYDNGKSSVNVSYRNVLVVNFDMSADDAQYTIADFVDGKPVPLTLRNGGGEVLELADTRGAYQIKDLSGNGNYATIFGEVISRYNENPTAMQVAYTWGSGVSTGAYIMGDTVTLPANSQIEIIGYSSTSMTLNVGSSASASTSFASAASIGTTPSSICTFYTGSSAQELYVTPSVAGASINLTIKVTQIE